MENWLVRSTMNVQRPPNTERREFVQGAGSVSVRNIRSSQQSFRGRIRGGRQIREHRERHVTIPEQLEASGLDTYYGGSSRATDENVDIPQLCSDGYLNSAKLLVHPRSITSGLPEDHLTKWDSLFLAVQLVHEDIACPICLYPPVFPRMERCGHVYCGPCAIQYITYENNLTAKKCAVCSWILRLEDLKRVRLTRVLPMKIGSMLDLVLLKRSNVKGTSQQITPVESVASAHCLPTYQFIEEATLDEVISNTLDEFQSLKAYKAVCIEDGNVEIVPHVNSLISQLEETLKDLTLPEREPSYAVRTEEVKPGKHTPVKDSDNEVSSPLPPSDSFCFYQACDGQLIFLDGLMWKCLLAEYNGVSNLPRMLNVTVSGVRTYKMNPVLRKRWRHLSHVPLGRTVSMIEVELESLVSESTLEQFSSALSIRLTERTRRQLEDARLTQLKEAAENRIPTIPQGFKLCGHAELSDQKSPPDPSEFVPLCATTEVHRKPNVTSFAEVTKMGAKSVVDRNRVATFARTSSNTHVPSFNPSAEIWPSLGDKTTRESTSFERSNNRTAWRLSLIEPIGVGDINNSSNLGHSITGSHDSSQRSSKKTRRRRSRLTDNI